MQIINFYCVWNTINQLSRENLTFVIFAMHTLMTRVKIKSHKMVFKWQVMLTAECRGINFCINSRKKLSKIEIISILRVNFLNKPCIITLFPNAIDGT